MSNATLSVLKACKTCLSRLHVSKAASYRSFRDISQSKVVNTADNMNLAARALALRHQSIAEHDLQYFPLLHSLSAHRRYSSSVSSLNVHSHDVILNAVNELSEEDLYDYEYVSKSLAKAIIEQRQQDGRFTSVEDILSVKGLTEEKMSLIAKAISGGSLKSQKGKNIAKSLSSLISPRLKLKQVPLNVVALHLQLPLITWIKMGKDLHVSDWHTVSLVDDGKKLKFDPALFQSKICELDASIPAAELYLLEDLQVRVSTAHIMPTLQRCYLDAGMTTLLNARHADYHSSQQRAPRERALVRTPTGELLDETQDVVLSETKRPTFQHLVYRLKPRAVSEYFQLLVGGERISSIQLLRDVSKGMSDAALGVDIDSETWQELWRLPKVIQEQRAQTLLIATTFYKMLTSQPTME